LKTAKTKHATMAASHRYLQRVANLTMSYLNVQMELKLRRCLITMDAAPSMSVNVSLSLAHGHFK